MIRLAVPVPRGRLTSLSEPERQALGWAMDHPGFSVRTVEPGGLDGVEAEIVWWHAARPGEPAPALLKALAGCRAAGVPLLLTGLALKALPALGLEERPPRSVEGTPWAGGVGEHELRGYMTYAGHPTFAAFGTGVYTWAPAAGVPVWDSWYHRDGDRPRGRIIAVERRYIAFDPTVVTALHYPDGAGGAVGALGAHLSFHDRRNPFRGHLERLVEAWIHWLAGRDPAAAPGAFVFTGWSREQRDLAWPLPGPGVRADEPDPAWVPVAADPILAPIVPDEVAAVWSSPAPEGHGQEVTATSDFFLDQAGARHFLLARARSGLDEAWTGGVRLFRRVRMVWEPDGGEPVALDEPGEETAVTVVARPDGLRREIAVPGGPRVRWLAAAHPEGPGGLLAAALETGEAGRLRLEVTADLRRMWPYPAGLLDPLRVADALPGLAVVTAQDPQVTGGLGLVGPAGAGAWTWIPEPGPDPSGDPEAAAVRLTGRVRVPAGGGGVVLAWTVDRQGAPAAARTLRRLLEERGALFERLRLLAGRRARARVRLQTPGRALGEDFERAADFLDPFRLTVEGLGTSQLAGFAATGEGWLSGRPGYAWFFGRDGVFTALGLLALGRHEAAREVLDFLAAQQEWTGKVPHEVSLSGAVHYDAADSTPLWLVLLGAWYRATGDRWGLADLWPAARRALAFCRRTDRDGDGLIENTGVGHGWIEGGRLHGAHVTSYLAGVWGAALDAAADGAEALGEGAEAERCRAEAARARQTLEQSFWVPSGRGGGHYGLGLLRDRTLQGDLTVMPTVPILLGQTDPERSRSHLVQLAGEAFSADWGVRMVGRQHPLFSPTGYHYGAIWPLFTGWTAQAEYAVHRSEAALGHVRATLAGVRDPSPGCLEEVLDGLHYAPTGVCPHQAWSHAPTLQAVVEGLVGWQPDLRAGRRSRLAPHLPEDWERFRVEGLRAGERRLSLELEGTPGDRVWTLRLEGEKGGEFPLRFEPALPPEARVEGVQVDGGHIRARIGEERDDRHLSLDVALAPGRGVRICVRYTFDVAVVLPEPELRPGGCSALWRLVDRWWEGDDAKEGPGACRLILEGPAESEAEVELLLPGRRPAGLEGAEWIEPPRRGRGRLRVVFPRVTDLTCDYSVAAVRITFS